MAVALAGASSLCVVLELRIAKMSRVRYYLAEALRVAETEKIYQEKLFDGIMQRQRLPSEFSLFCCVACRQLSK